MRATERLWSMYSGRQVTSTLQLPDSPTLAKAASSAAAGATVKCDRRGTASCTAAACAPAGISTSSVV
jgi:hypothetical protein